MAVELHTALAAMKPLLTETIADYSGMVAYDNGILRAYDGVNSIKVSVLDVDTEPWCVDGTKLAAVVNKLSKLKLSDKHLVVTNGRARFQLYTHDGETLLPDYFDHDLAPTPISADDWAVLKKAATFKSPHAVYPWAACIYIRNHKAYVTNNIVVVVFDIGLDVEGMIPAIAVDSLATADNVHIDPRCIILQRESLSLRCALPEVEPPSVFFSKCDEIGEAQTPVNTELAAAFESTIMIDPRVVKINGHGISATSTKGDIVDVDIETGSQTEGLYDPRYVVPMLKIAEFVDWDNYPRPVLFRAPGIKGMLVGRREGEPND